MNRLFVRFAAVAFVASVCAAPAQSAIIQAWNFNNIVGSSTPGVPPGGWTVSGGTVDTIAMPNSFGIACRGGTGGCVDLDGTPGGSGLLSNGVFTIQPGQTFTLSAWVSGNQRNTDNESLSFGFRDNANIATIIASASSPTLASAANLANFQQIQVTYSNQTAAAQNLRVFFLGVGADLRGAILDDVVLSAVPLPAAAWLLLSGLAGLGFVARRRSE